MIEVTRIRRIGEIRTVGSATAIIREKIPNTSITIFPFFVLGTLYNTPIKCTNEET